MPAAAEADGVRASGGGYLQLTEEQARALISSQPIERDYEVEEEPFARGKYAAVRRCRSRAGAAGAAAPWRFAAKYLRKWRRAANLRNEILHEVAILHACRRSPRVVQLFGVYESDQEMVLLLELAEGGELQMLLDRDIVPEEEQVRQLMLQILMGLRDLHDLNVAHLDIKPQNLVLTGEFPNCDVKLCDLGISRYVGEGADIRDMLGTPDYVAPEVLNYEPISLATDMWSVGVLLYVLLTGCSPFGGDTKQETFCNISQCNLDFPEDLFEDVSEEAKDLMRKLMVKEPSKRLTVQESLRHPWFSVTPVASPISAVFETKNEVSSMNGTSLFSKGTEHISPMTSRKLEKSSPALSKKMDRPSPTMMRKPGKELPEPIKNNDLPPSLLKRTLPVTREATIRSEPTTPISKQLVTAASVTVKEMSSILEVQQGADGNATDRSSCGMKSFRKTTFKKNMGSILERVTSCEDFENNNDFGSNNSTTTSSNTNDTSNSSSNSDKANYVTPISHSNSTGNEHTTHVNSISISTSSRSTANGSDNSSNTNNNNNTTVKNSNSNKISNNVSTLISSCSMNGSVTGSTENNSSSINSSSSNNLCPPKSNNVTVHRTLFEANKLSVRLSASSKKVPAPETPAANSNASIASLTMPRLNRATATQTMPLGGVREFKLKFEHPPTFTTTKTIPSITAIQHSVTTLSKTAATNTVTSSSSISSMTSVTPSRISVVVTPSAPISMSYSGSQKTEEKDCIYTFRRCYIVDDGENDNGNSLVSDGTNESEASSGYYDNSSCCSSSDSVSDVSETSADSSGDRLSTASMDSLDSCYGKEKKFSSTPVPFPLRNTYNKRVSSLKSETNSKTHQSPAFHLAVSTFNRIQENTNKISSQQEELEQEKIFAAARRQAAKASHTTVINKVARASFVPVSTSNPIVRKECALNITRERNGKEVVLQEVKAGKCSRFSEVKIESVQSRIKRFQS